VLFRSGKKVGQLARDAGQDPWDWFLDFALADDLKTMFDVRLFNIDEDRVAELLRYEYGAIALSDAGAHLSFLCDAGFGLHLMGHWARDKGEMSLEQAVQTLTSRPADIYRIKERGRLIPGAWADLMLFDPQTVARGPKVRVNDLPTGAERIDTAAVGLEGVWVNGVRTVTDGANLADCGTPGHLLRDFTDAA
jgi:N-acyl-D-aspartate/D-glutamate deacylase